MARYYFLPKRLRAAASNHQRLIWRVEGWLIGLLFTVLKILPLRWALAFAGSSFAFFGPYSPRATKVGNNLRIAFPDKSEAQIRNNMRGVFRHLGTAMAELVRLDRIWRERAYRMEFHLLPGAATPTPGRKTVFVTAHCGAWQLTTLVAPYYGLTVPLIYAPEENPYVDRKLATLREAFGSPLVSRDGGVRVLMRALEKGHSIGLTMDTRMDAGEPVPFFGEDALTNTAPARLALRYGCDVVPVLAERLPKARYRINIYPPITPSNTDADSNQQALDITRQINALFESWIVDMPSQWLCLKRRWPNASYRRFLQ